MGIPADWVDLPREALEVDIGDGETKSISVRRSGPGDYYFVDDSGELLPMVIASHHLPDGPTSANGIDKLSVGFERVRVEGRDVIAYLQTDRGVSCRIGRLIPKE